MVAPADSGELQDTSRHAVKLLDSLTNRYHVGLLESAWEQGMRVELAPSVHLRAGQRVKFVVGDGEALVTRGSMKRALISDVDLGASDRISIELAVMPGLS